jgi:hypothetical protein
MKCNHSDEATLATSAALSCCLTRERVRSRPKQTSRNVIPFGNRKRQSVGLLLFVREAVQETLSERDQCASAALDDCEMGRPRNNTPLRTNVGFMPPNVA